MEPKRLQFIKNKITVRAAALGCLVFFSCEHCDDDSNTAGISADLVGLYEMSSWNSPSAADLDNDGDSSANMMAESPCYDNSIIVLLQNGTFTQTHNSIHIRDGAISCADSQNMTGIWKRSGDTVTTAAMVNGTRVERAYSVTEAATGKKLNLSLSDSQYPTMSSGNASWEAGAINIEFTKRNSL
ncbi:hypothetical protein GGR22_002384 [Flavobacterium gossypii]|uniref:Lipocalin-like domain-containing protein n=1 Tax=Flavobacterium gossypii TaxID=1646119 RepID=A0ABR6DRA0_9FLAO|nr:lipocalin family protein [Flavobacterium gossypii]MBA9074217.1 hypothetical protein [Flavobacterium gossypii]